MANQTTLDTEELIERMGRFRRWVLPSGVMQELLSRGSDIAPALIQHLTRALDPAVGLEPHAPEAFFCFYLLGVDCESPRHKVSCMKFIESLFRSEDELLDGCTGEVTQSFVRALIASLVDKNDPASFCEWVDSLVRDDRVNQFGKLHLVNSLFNLLGDGLLEDVEVVRWVRKWLEYRKEFRRDYLSSMIVGDFIPVGGEDLRELAVECFERDQIYRGYVGLEELDELSDERQVDYVRARAEADRQLLADPIGHLKTWDAFAWTTDAFDPQSATYESIPKARGWPKTQPVPGELDRWLAAIDRSNYKICPHTAIRDAHRYVDQAIDQLKQRVRRGIERAQQGEALSSNGPYLCALMLAQECDTPPVLITDADVFLDILDLTSEQRGEWFGESIDIFLNAAVASVLVGKTQPILQRIGDPARSDRDRAALIPFFTISVYLGFLSRDRCLEILRELWGSSLHEGIQGGRDHRTMLSAIYDAFCLLSIADDDPVMREAKQAGIENTLITEELLAVFRSEPGKARYVMSQKILGPRRLQNAIELGGQFDADAIKEIPVKAERGRKHLYPHSTLLDTNFTKPQKVGRNAPCPCGSGKKYKKCCGTG